LTEPLVQLAGVPGHSCAPDPAVLQVSVLVAGLNTAAAGLNGLAEVLSETPSTIS
jgi:hypothetical protein